MKKIKQSKNKLIALTSVLLFFTAIATPLAVLAATADVQGSLCSGSNNIQISDSGGDCTNEDNGATTTANNIITDIVDLLSVIVGLVAVIMIILGGFRYITSGGSSDKVSGAKNTILYAIIGLVVVALAQVIVQFVLNKAANPTDCVNHVIQSGANKGKGC